MKTTKKKCPKKKPLAMMFWYGTEEHELAQCFKDSRAKLIRAKAKAQNLPKSSEQALDLLLSLTDEAMVIVRKWFQEKAKFELERQPETALEILKSLPLSKIDSDELKEEWRSLLSLFSQDTIPEILREFLQLKDSQKSKAVLPVQLATSKKPAEEVRDKGKEKVKEKEKQKQKETVTAIEIETDKQKTEEKQKEIETQTEKQKEGFFVTREMVQSYLKTLNEKLETSDENVLGSLLEGAIAATKGDQAACERAKVAITKSAGLIGPDLNALISQFESNEGRTGLRLRKSLSQKNSLSVDPELYSAVAEIRKILPSGQFFANVIGMMVEQDLLELSPADARNVYPLAGEILAFPNTISGHHHEGELAIWRTERRTTDKQNKFIITALHARLYEVISVPHPSTEPDGLREWLLIFYQNLTANLPIFELSDGRLVRLPGDPKDTKSIKFEIPVDLYESLDAIELSNGRRFVVSPLPAAVQKLDCAPPITTIKRLLKIQKTGEQFPAFSRAQVDALSDLIKAEVDYPIMPSIARATERLGAISDLKEQLDEVVAEMLSLPKVSQQIEEEKKSVVQKFAEEQSDYQEKLKKLKEEKIKLEGEISAAKKSIKAQEQELATHIKDKFQKAQNEGMETLAQVALFGGLIGVGQNSDSRLIKEAQHIGSRLASVETGTELTSLDALKIALARVSYSSGMSPQLMSAVMSSGFACGAVGLIGENREAVVQMLSTVLAGGMRCRVSISVDMFSISDVLRSPALVKAGGHTIGMPFGEFLEVQSSLKRTSVVELVGANRMPPESYLPDLMDMLRTSITPSSVAWTTSDGNIKTTILHAPVLLLLSFLSGKSTFPLVSPLSTQVPCVAVDFPWGDEPQADKSVIVKPSHLTVPAWSELVQQPPLRTKDAVVLSSDTCGCLENALENSGCNEPESLAKALLQAGRPGYMLNPLEGSSSVTSIVKKIHEVMHGCSASLFVQSVDDGR